MLYRYSGRCFCSITLSSLCRSGRFEKRGKTKQNRNSDRTQFMDKYTRYESYLCVYTLNDTNENIFKFILY